MSARRCPADRVTLERLASRPFWVGWQTEISKGREKPTKVPYNPTRLNGRHVKAESDDPATWGTRAQAEKKAEALPRPFDESGTGLMFTSLDADWCVGGVDLDTCRSPEGEIEPWADEVIGRFDTYTEVSPSGGGVKLFFTYRQADLRALREAMGTEHGRQFKRANGREHPPAIELHISRRFYAVTWERLPDSPVELRPAALDTLLWLIRDAGPKFALKSARNNGGGGGHDGSRSGIAFRKGAALRRAGKTFEELYAALRDDPETTDWVREKGEANGQRELRRIWDKADASTPAWLVELNADWAVIQVGGKVRVMTEQIEVDDQGAKLCKPDFLRADDFKLLLANHTTEINGAAVPVAPLWLKHPARRTFRGLGMYPPPLPTRGGRYNLWRGFGVQPAQGNWKLLRWHFEHVLCGGDQFEAAYFLNWNAYGLQHLDRKPQTAILLIGRPGGGKGLYGHLMRGIYGMHGRYLTKKDQVIGKHNAQLANAMFAYVDEAFFGGDRAAAAALKPLITDPVMTIEPKFVDMYEVPNRMRMVFASNERHAMHLDLDDRRIAAFETAWPWKDQHEQLDYADKLRAEIRDGGAAAFLYDMLHRDLTGFDERAIPATLLRAEQQTLSLHGTAAWWYDTLNRGELWEGPNTEIGKPVQISKSFLYKDYVEWTRARKSEYLMDGNREFWRVLRNLVELRETRPRDDGLRTRSVWLPPLDEARSQFEQRNNLGTCIEWGDE